MDRVLRIQAIAFTAVSIAAGMAYAQSPADIARTYEVAARQEAPGFDGFSAQRGEQLFQSTHGREWSCASCHTQNPRQPGTHAKTGQRIAPLAPAANGDRFTSLDKSREMVPAQLQRRRGPALHCPGERRRAGVSDAGQTLGARDESGMQAMGVPDGRMGHGCDLRIGPRRECGCGRIEGIAGHQCGVEQRMRRLPSAVSAPVAPAGLLAGTDAGPRQAFRHRRQRRSEDSGDDRRLPRSECRP